MTHLSFVLDEDFGFFLGGGSGGGIDGVEMRLMAMRSRPEDTRPVEPRAPTNLPDEFFEHKKTDTVCLDGALSPPSVAPGVITDERGLDFFS